MNDNFDVKLGWSGTLKNGQTDSNSRLKRIDRYQSFSVWLLAYDETGDKIYILKELGWTVNLSIVLNPDAKRGNQAKLANWNLDWVYPETSQFIDPSWLNAPTANESQVFVGY